MFLFHNYGLATIQVSWQNNKPVIQSPSSLLFEDYEYAAALCDRQNNWWLGTTEHGMQKISPGKQYFKSQSITDKTTGLPVKYDINSISQFAHRLWVSTYGNGFFEVNNLTGKTEQHFIYTTAGDRWPNFTWNIRQINTDTAWIGTQAGMFWYSISKKTYGRIAAYPGKPAALDSFAITTQFTDSYGLVWIGLGKSHGVCTFDQKNRRFTWYPANSEEGYPLRYPTQVAEDK